MDNARVYPPNRAPQFKVGDITIGVIEKYVREDDDGTIEERPWANILYPDGTLDLPVHFDNVDEITLFNSEHKPVHYQKTASMKVMKVSEGYYTMHCLVETIK